MDDSLINDIQTFTLHVREILEREADEQLQGIYGWLPDGTFAAAKAYPAVADLEEARETRQRLERFAQDEKTAGFDAKAARTKLKREASFTWLNRLIAFRLMEERNLRKATIVKLDKSNAFIYWLTLDDANKEEYALHQQGSLPLNAMGEGPSDIAYRRFILWQCGELARDVSVLFDPTTLASRLFPRPAVLKELIAGMTAEALTPAWQPGNEETVGWVYQAFNAEELQAAFAGAREQGKKFEPEDIPAVTQLFTIRWVVRFLVQNTLGRLWVEMHPDSRLKDLLDYLVPVKKTQPRPLKLARDISFLDPCCGSMHFGLIAFDLFVEMYREELEKAGQTGWPFKPSVSSEDEIAASIITHNVHGIDIDLRAVQLSTLTLLLRARTLNPQCNFNDQNLACANVEEITGGRLEEFIKQAQFSHPIYERILRALASRLKDSNNLGSLLRLDRDLEDLIADERRRVDADKQFTLAFPGLSPEQFKTQAGIDEFFDILTDQVRRHLDHFVQASRTKGADPGHFVSETAKGLRFMRIIQQRYDVVATNPPYLSARKMNKRLAKLMADQYPEAKSDLYAAFIIRCQELLKDEGLLGMLTMHSFMFISSYEDLRAKLRNQIAIETLAHFGGGLFAVGNPGTLQTVAFVLRREPDEQQRQEQVGVFFRLVKEPDADSKRRAFEAGLTKVRGGESDSQVFRYVQRDFDAIPGKPWVYSLTEAIRKIFPKFPPISDSHYACRGIQTSDNSRFLRFWWEVGCSRIAHVAKRRSKLQWVPYMKGGPLIRWYGNQEYVLKWGESGEELYAFRPYAVIRNADLMFSEGATFSTITSGRIGFRYMPPGFCWDQSGSAIIRKSGSIKPDLAILNSTVTAYLAKLVAPTINYTIGDVANVPFCSNDARFKATATEFVETAIALAKTDCAESEITRDFIRPSNNSSEIYERKSKLEQIEGKLDLVVSRLYGLSDKELGRIEEELSLTVSASVSDEDDLSGEKTTVDTEVTQVTVAQHWISYACGTVLSRFEVGKNGSLGCGDFSAKTVTAFHKLVDGDGIMVSEPKHPEDIVNRVLACLELMMGRTEAHATVRTATSNDGDPEYVLRDWFDRLFWKYHYKLYCNRPVYWPLQSPKKRFTVWVFHERFTKDTLFHIRRNIVDVRLRLLEREIVDKRKEATTNKAAAKQLDKQRDLEDDLREFSKRLKEMADRGYTPHIDDGVLLNAAPLHSLLPSWPDTKKAWDELEEGEYDWARQAMEYWPERVKQKCKTNKSFAIAHGLA